MGRVLDIGDRVKLILDGKNIAVTLSEDDRAILSGAIAFHLSDYAEQELQLFLAGVLV